MCQNTHILRIQFFVFCDYVYLYLCHIKKVIQRKDNIIECIIYNIILKNIYSVKFTIIFVNCKTLYYVGFRIVSRLFIIVCVHKC